MSTIEVVFVLISTVIGVAVGATITLSVVRKQNEAEKLSITESAIATAAAQEKSIRERIDEKDRSIAILNLDLTNLRDESSEIRAKLAGATEAAESHHREMASQKTSRDEMIAVQKDERQKSVDELNKLARTYDEKMKEAFGALSTKALRSATDDFMKLAQETFSSKTADAKQDLEQRKIAIETLLKPIQENLSKLDKQCTELETKREVAYTSIEHQVTGMLSAAADLNNALRKPTLRGSWGEKTLTTVVENAGLQEGVHFMLQHSTDTEDGKLRADMVVNLPKNRRIAIDSKATLDAFRNAVNCTDDAQREELMKKHASQVRSHMKSLSEKNTGNNTRASIVFSCFSLVKLCSIPLSSTIPIFLRTRERIKFIWPTHRPLWQRLTQWLMF